ncbi:hypothetical protein LTS10_011123 [Elasticomyces elasticus]|nr:hypothetical protein LTS10_011123 [Elasticomyces elasticus]
MPEPLTAFAAKEAAIIGSGLAEEGYQFVRRVQQAPEKARGFESRINAAENILRNAALNLSETEVVQPHLAAVRTAVVAAQSKHEYELKNPKTGKISKTSVATSNTSIDRLKDDIGGALQGLHASVGLHTLEVTTQTHKLVQGSPAAYEELLRRRDVQQRQWFEERLQMLKQQMFQEFALSQQQLLQNVFGSMMQPIEQHTAALHGLLPQLQQAILTDKLPPANGNEDIVFTFVADITAAPGSIVDEFIINRADRPDELPDDDLIIVFSRWRPQDGLRCFEIHARACDLLRFLPEYRGLYSGPHTRWRDYHEQLQNLAANMRDLESPLQVRCLKPSNADRIYPPVSKFTRYDLQCHDESEISVLDHLAGWVYRVELNGQRLTRKDITDPSQLEGFIAEVEALYELQGVKNIVKVHGLVTSGAQAIVKGMLLERLEPLGRSISIGSGLVLDLVDNPFRISFPGGVGPGVQIIQDILQIVVDVHERGFVIGEVVSAQFGLTDDHRVKLLGIKKRGSPLGAHAPETRAKFGEARLSIFVRESIFEQASRRLSTKSDVWQLGALLLDMITGYEILAGEVADFEIHRMDHRVRWLLPMIRSCLATDPARRPSASQVLQDFRELLREEECKAVETTRLAKYETQFPVPASNGRRGVGVCP